MAERMKRTWVVCCLMQMAIKTWTFLLIAAARNLRLVPLTTCRGYIRTMAKAILPWMRPRCPRPFIPVHSALQLTITMVMAILIYLLADDYCLVSILFLPAATFCKIMAREFLPM